ncbi:C4-dicarboxylate ABC transporter, partial [Pseudomonas aeruginosa]
LAQALQRLCQDALYLNKILIYQQVK